MSKAVKIKAEQAVQLMDTLRIGANMFASSAKFSYALDLTADRLAIAVKPINKRSSDDEGLKRYRAEIDAVKKKAEEVVKATPDKAKEAFDKAGEEIKALSEKYSEELDRAEEYMQLEVEVKPHRFEDSLLPTEAAVEKAKTKLENGSVLTGTEIIKPLLNSIRLLDMVIHDD